MPPPATPSLPPTAKPRHGKTFDSWNSSATGHQRPETRVGLGWRHSRNMKLKGQFAGGHSGGKRTSDTYGAGSEDFDEKLGMVVPKAVRARAQMNVMDMLAKPGSMKQREKNQVACSETDGGVREDTEGQGALTGEERLTESRRRQDEARDQETKNRQRGIFDGVVVYVNGSTAPLVSDHKLKRVLVENGANTSLHLGRRQVTHVIVGRPVGGGVGSGGGLAGGKLDKEIKRKGGCAVTYVGVEWVLESLKAGKRLPESRFASMKLAPQGQRSVLNMRAAQPPSRM